MGNKQYTNDGLTVSSLIHSCGGCSPPNPHSSFVYDCSCFLTFVGYSQASFILATFLQVFLVNFAASCCSVSMSLLQILYITFTASYCTVSKTLFRILHITFTASCTTFLGFVHDFSPGLSCSCHSFILHCQHGSSVKFLVNPPSFCQLYSDCFPRSTTPRILHAFTLLLSSRVHTI